MAKGSAAASCWYCCNVLAQFVIDVLDGSVHGDTNDFGAGLDGKASINLLTVVLVAIVELPVGLPVGVGCVASAVGC